MKPRRIAVPVLVAALWFAACGQDPPPPPAPTGPTEEELAQRRADSIAEAARQDSIARAEATARAAEEARMRGIAAARETLREMVFFEYDESRLTSEAELKLRNKVEVLRASPAVRIRIEGHADERGSTEYNLALGSRRAESVREYLVGFGLDPNRFEVTSYGEERPLVNASNEDAWARNRRAEFVITAGEDQINPVMD
ncbi:MAG: OmpA family protein [Gemmatimonadota bacterium]|jgi:peptidoglycan-associated lipoprotein